MASTVLILPGYGNSGEMHWQSLWEQKNPHFMRVYQDNWLLPEKESWVASLEKMLAQTEDEVILIAHSMACLVVAHWASRPHKAIKAALLVAVPNPDEPAFPADAKGFENTPTTAFDFPSIVVASSNDVYASLEFAHKMAQAWGSEYVNVGEKGHINADSGLGFWDEGWKLLQKLEERY